MAEYARVAEIDWGKRASMHFDGSSGQDSTLSVHDGKVSAGPPTVEKRRATWEVDLAGPRIFASAFVSTWTALPPTAVSRPLVGAPS